MGAAIFSTTRQDAYRGPVSLLKEAYEETESRGPRPRPRPRPRLRRNFRG